MSFRPDDARILVRVNITPNYPEPFSWAGYVTYVGQAEDVTQHVRGTEQPPFGLGVLSSRFGKEAEIVFIPQKIAERLKQYIREKGVMINDKIFPITYPAARTVVKRRVN